MKNSKFVLFLFVVLHLLILFKLQFTAWPEMVSFPYLINQGFVTYKDMVHAYPPLLINILAVLYKTFGYNVWVLKLFGWLTFVVSDIFIYLIIKKITKKNNLAILGTLTYIILQPILDGNMVWPDLTLIPFLLVGFWFLLEKKYFWSGLIFVLALLVKQTGIFYLGVVGLFLIFNQKNKILNFLIWGTTVLFLFVFNLVVNGSFKDFLNWAVIYPSKYWTKFPGYVQLRPSLREDMILFILLVPVVILILKLRKRIVSDKYFLLLFGFLICGIVGVYPRFSFFHLQPGLVFLVILITYLMSKTKLSRYYILLIPLLVLILNFRNLQFGGVRFWNQNDLILAKEIESESPKGKPIYLLGLNSNLYAFANKLPNKPWVDNFGWYFEINSVQNSVIHGLESDPPSTIFWRTPDSGNWYDIGTYQPKMITDWIQKNYMKKMEIQKGVWEWVRR